MPIYGGEKERDDAWALVGERVQEAWDKNPAIGYVSLMFVIPVEEGHSVILLERDSHPIAGRPYVTYAFNHADKAFHTGHYDLDLVAALRDFADRIERGY